MACWITINYEVIKVSVAEFQMYNALGSKTFSIIYYPSPITQFLSCLPPPQACLGSSHILLHHCPIFPPLTSSPCPCLPSGSFLLKTNSLGLPFYYHWAFDICRGVSLYPTHREGIIQSLFLFLKLISIHMILSRSIPIATDHKTSSSLVTS